MNDLGSTAYRTESAPSPGPTEREPTHAQLVVADLATWVGLVASLQLFRAILLWLFRAELGSGVEAPQVLRCFAVGLRFDASVATYFCLPLAVLGVMGFIRPFARLHRATRVYLTIITSFIFALTFATDIAYFKEYHNQFDHWIWGLVFDDRRAIALTVWKGYPVVWLSIGLVLLAALLSGLLIASSSWLSRRRCVAGLVVSGGWRIAAVAVLAGVVVLGLRGSLGRRPVQLKDAAVCNDRFLDKLVPNPFTALRYAVKQHLAVLKPVGLETILPGSDIRAAARAQNPAARPDATLDDYLQRAATGPPATAPQHIFLVVMESYDAWAMQPKFRSLHLTDRLMALGRAGVMAEAFLPAGDGTMPSLATLICGLPDVGIQPNYRESVRTGLPTAAATIFKRLGYRTRFFYSGYPSWQRLGEFCSEQGFDEVYGGAAMSHGLTGNEWGVDDRVLFRFVLDRTTDQPTFNMLMTTSYHPPHSVNLEAEGFPLKQLPPDLAQYEVTGEELRILGHLWYSDRCLGEFAESAVRQFPGALLAFTGDHWSRRCLAPRPSIFERKAVPFVLYGPSVLTNTVPPRHLVGSHIDLLPTLIELAAPANFLYHAFGRNLLDPSQPQLGFGVGTVVSPDFIFEVDRLAEAESLGGGLPVSLERGAELARRYRQMHGLAWWRIMKGNLLPVSDAASSSR